MKSDTIINTVSAAEHNHGNHFHKEAHADHMLEGYVVVANALYKDDLAKSKFLAAVKSQTALEIGA